ncbi:MAG: protein kinase, partial [Chloroflexi bacterium]|nr:protein kinase [Chloroflexota bacterium]
MSQPTWIGQTLGGRYQITELLGQGGMSAVYKATDPNLRRVVAIKLIHAHLSSDPEFVRRFEEEAAAVAKLRHPNIIQVYDFNHDGPLYFIVFEFVPGETLQSRLKRLNDDNRFMPVKDAVGLGINVSEALDYAHSRGLIHRDIKPANVMLDVHGQAILMDFGIVKIMGGDSHTATGAVLGTARYMSPEQIKGQQVDARSDIYSMGVMLFEALGGRPPFKADSAMTLMMMHVNDPVPDLRQLRPDIPLDVVAVVNKALAKERSDRYQTAAEMAAALRAARLELPPAEATILEMPATARTPEKTTILPPPPPPTRVPAA